MENKKNINLKWKKAISLFIISVMLAIPVFPVSASSHNPYNGIVMTTFDEAVKTNSAFNSDSRGFVKGVTGSAYLIFKDVNFGTSAPNEAEMIIGTVGAKADSKVEVRLGSPTGPILVTFPLTNGNWYPGIVVPGTIEREVTGVQDLYVSTVGGSAANLFKMTFYAPAVDTSGYMEYKEASYFKDTAGSAYEQEIDMLYEMGIVEGFDGEKYEPNVGISRIDFATLIYRAIGAGTSNVSLPFPDVDSGHKSYGALCWLYENGIISGDEHGNFNPYSFVTVTEASTLALRVLGFSSLAEHFGGYPAGYMKLAAQEKLLDGLSGAKYLTRGAMARFLCNFMEADYLDVVTISGEQIDYERRTGILSRDKDIYITEGRMTATGITGLRTPISDLERDEVLVDGVAYKTGESRAAALLGYNVKMYWQEDDGVKTILSAMPKKNNTTTMLASNEELIETVTEQELIYVDTSGKEEHIRFNASTAFIYNGKAIESTLDKVLEPGKFSGTIRLVETSGGEMVVFVDQSKSYKVSFIDTQKMMLYNGDMSESVSYDEDRNYVRITQNGVMARTSDLALGSIITVYQSKNKSGSRLNRIELITSTITGMVSMVSDEEITIDGVIYHSVLEEPNEIRPGIMATFYLNHLDEIVALSADDVSTDGEKTGLFLGVDYSGQTSLASHCSVMIFDKDGTTNIYEFADTVVADGCVCREASALYNGNDAFGGLRSLSKYDLIRYRFNADGKISMIDTGFAGAGGQNDKLLKITSSRDVLYLNTEGQSFSMTGGKTAFVYETEPSLFSIGVEGDDDSITYKDAVSTGYKVATAITGDLYTMDSDLNAVSYVVWFGTEGKEDWNNPIVFTEKAIALNADGEPVMRITGKTGSGEVNYLIPDSVLSTGSDMEKILGSISVGDVIRFKTRVDGTASTIQLIASCVGSDAVGGVAVTVGENKQVYNGDNYQYTRFLWGTIAEKSKGLLAVEFVENEKIQREPLYFDKNIVLFDASRNRVTNGLDHSNLLIGDRVLVCITDRKLSLVVKYEN